MKVLAGRFAAPNVAPGWWVDQAVARLGVSRSSADRNGEQAGVEAVSTEAGVDRPAD